MFTGLEKDSLRAHFKKPLRLDALRANAQTIMDKTRYKIHTNFIRALLDEEVVHAHEFTANNGKRIRLYSSQPLENLTPYEIASAMFPGGYFCNLTAVYYHSLTNQIPKTVYVCTESNAQKGTANDELTDSRLRQAFLKPSRHTNYVFDAYGFNVVVIERMKHTDHGVVSVKPEAGFLPSTSRVACVERALIDAVVSPQYNGGISSVPAYFQHARGKVNAVKLIEIYRSLDFVYPYFQALGFLLERTGMLEMADAIRAEFTPTNKFYIDHSAKVSWKYDEKWMIYYPEGIVDEY